MELLPNLLALVQHRVEQALLELELLVLAHPLVCLVIPLHQNQLFLQALEALGARWVDLVQQTRLVQDYLGLQAAVGLALEFLVLRIKLALVPLLVRPLGWALDLGEHQHLEVS